MTLQQFQTNFDYGFFITSLVEDFFLSDLSLHCSTRVILVVKDIKPPLYIKRLTMKPNAGVIAPKRPPMSPKKSRKLYIIRLYDSLVRLNSNVTEFQKLFL